ncbi:MAG: alpha/beta fold hydrolase [Acidimicrobiales bacterium]|nr:alpha/beta fold hydrolase [Acidimicrobiales bacterium]
MALEPALHAERRGAGPRLVLVHGFTQNCHCWGPIASDLANDHEVVLVDAPGHGQSPPATPGFLAGAKSIGTVGGRATYIGYSMGGRYCLALALERPELVDRLVLISASPGIEDDLARAERRLADEALADHVVTVGTDRFLAEWLTQPFFATLDEETACLRERRHNTSAGLASSLRHAGAGAQPSLWPRLAELEMPVLLVTGELDDKFRGIATAMTAAIGPNSTHVLVADASHTAHLEQSAQFLSILRRWLVHTAEEAPER